MQESENLALGFPEGSSWNKGKGIGAEAATAARLVDPHQAPTGRSQARLGVVQSRYR